MSRTSHYQHQRDKNSTRGFSLLETLVVLALFIMVLLAFFSFYLQFQTLYGVGQAQADTAGQARTALTDFSTYIPQAHRVLANQIINGVLYTSGTSTLVLQLPSINSNGDIIANTWDYAAYYTSSTYLYRTLQPNALSVRFSETRTLASTVSSTAFSYDAADFSQVKNITVDVQTTKQTNHRTVNDHVSAQLLLRNF